MKLPLETKIMLTRKDKWCKFKQITTLFTDLSNFPRGPGKGLATENEPCSSIIVFCVQKGNNEIIKNSVHMVTT